MASCLALLIVEWLPLDDRRDNNVNHNSNAVILTVVSQGNLMHHVRLEPPHYNYHYYFC